MIIDVVFVGFYRSQPPAGAGGLSGRAIYCKGLITVTMQSAANRSFSRRWGEYRPTKTMMFWACAASIVATMVVGFAWGGWVTGGTSHTLAAAAGQVARGELASAICVQRFNAAPDAAARRVEFKALADGYRKRQFVEAGGWATMPGQSTPDRLGVEGCAAALAA